MSFKRELYYGDCLDIMNNIDDESIDMIFADLPYNITKNKWDIIIDPIKLWKQYERIIKSNGIIILTASQPFTSLMVNSNLKLFKYSLVWQKTTPTGHLNAKKMPMRIHEDILIFYKNPPTYNPQKTTGHIRKVSTANHKRNSKKTTNYNEHGLTGYDSTERYPTSILTFATDKQKSSLHPTQKPVSLLEYLIKTYTNEGDIVLDNVAGSGTTGVACDNLNRQFILIEKELEYVEIIKNRIIILVK
jgi:site-specific DNA-methyltransferase (adenine-specific)